MYPWPQEEPSLYMVLEVRCVWIGSQSHYFYNAYGNDCGDRERGGGVYSFGAWVMFFFFD